MRKSQMPLFCVVDFQYAECFSESFLMYFQPWLLHFTTVAVLVCLQHELPSNVFLEFRKLFFDFA